MSKVERIACSKSCSCQDVLGTDCGRIRDVLCIRDILGGIRAASVLKTTMMMTWLSAAYPRLVATCSSLYAPPCAGYRDASGAPQTRVLELPLQTGYGHIRDILGDIFGCTRGILECIRDEFRTYNGHIRDVFGTYKGRIRTYKGPVDGRWLQSTCA